ncbi:aminoacyl-tRNA hydrolase, partial [bacterium]|nr:aminoacyl-tRNA hydrolase [candidate division CSSED10-310 bacterium]
MSPVQWVIAGLGNPGVEYEKTRHNLGFRMMDHLAGMMRGGGWRAGGGALQWAGMMAGQSVVLVKPQEFMNNSGRPV